MSARAPDAALTARLADSRQWSRSGGTDGAPFVGVNEDLSGLDLRESVLADASLQGADLRGTSLDGADLRSASIDGADLRGASLFKANLAKARATSADLSFVQADLTNWRAADLTRSTLQSGSFRQAFAVSMTATECNLRDTDFSGSDLSGASFFASDTTGARLFLAVVDQLVLSASALIDGRLTADALGDPIGLSDRRGETRVSDGVVWELRVAEALRSTSLVERIFYAVPETDFVVQVRGTTLVAVEAKIRMTGREPHDAGRKNALAHDLIVVREPEPDLPGITTLDGIESYLVSMTRERREGRGAILLARRQQQRLAPYTEAPSRPGVSLGRGRTHRTAISRWQREHRSDLERLARAAVNDPLERIPEKPELALLALLGVDLEEQLTRLRAGLGAESE